MSRLRQVFSGILVALISLSIVGGGISLAFQEGEVEIAQIAPSAPTEAPNQPISPTEREGEAPPSVPGPGTFTATPEVVIEDGGCTPPQDWVPIRVKPGETIRELANRYQIDKDELISGNCLEVDELRGGVLFVPEQPLPTPSPTRTPSPIATRDPLVCGPEPGWILYTVKPNDNLFRLSITYGITVEDLRWANCLGASNLINTGQQLYVPPNPVQDPETTSVPTTEPPTVQVTETPAPTATTTQTATPEPVTATPTSEAPTLTPTQTGTTPPTGTSTPTPTQSPTLEPSQTTTATSTPSPTFTLSPTLTPTDQPPSATEPTGGFQP